MSTTLTTPTPAAIGPLRRTWRMFWLRQKVRWAKQDIADIEHQMAKDLAQLEVHAACIAEWEAEIIFHQPPTKA